MKWNKYNNLPVMVTQIRLILETVKKAFEPSEDLAHQTAKLKKVCLNIKATVTVSTASNQITGDPDSKADPDETLPSHLENMAKANSKYLFPSDSSLQPPFYYILPCCGEMSVSLLS